MNNNTNVNPTTRPHVIPTNWLCEACPHFHRENEWNYRGACCAVFDDEEPHIVAVYEDDETPICSRVALQGFVARMCADDNRRHIRGDYGHADDGNYYSADYCGTYFYMCENCGEWIIDRDDYDRELGMCRACADEYRREQNRLIGNWHEHKGCFDVIGDSESPYTLGFEMEVEGSDRDHEETAHAIYDTFGGAFVFEYDCSLYDGFEIISQPHTLEAFEALDLEALERLLIEEGYEETDDAETTGLHIHFSTAFLGDTNEDRKRTLARMIRFYDANFETLCDITDRKDTGHSAPNYYENVSRESDYYDDDDELVYYNVEGSRYVAVNCNHFRRGTIEVRLCDGTIRADKVRAWADFNIALMTCLQEHDTDNMRAVVPYMSDRCINYFSRRCAL